VAKRLDESRCHLVGLLRYASARPHCVTWGPRFSPPQKGTHTPFSAHVYCGQTVKWIKMPLGTEIGLCPNDIVLDGAQLPPPKKRKVHSSPHFSAHVCCGHWPNDCMDQDATFHLVGGRPGPRVYCVRWGLSCPQGAQQTSPIFGQQQPPLLRFTDCVRINCGQCLLLWRNGRPSQLPVSTCLTSQPLTLYLPTMIYI